MALALDPTLAALLVTTCAGLITQVANLIVTLYKESRNRKWAQQDREERLVTASNLTNHVSHTTAELAKKIDENTEISVHALEETGVVSQKVLQQSEEQQKVSNRIKLMIDKFGIPDGD